MTTVGTVYLLHFDRPYAHAAHYTGWAADLDARLAEHAAGRGARLLAVVRAAGIGWRLARTWTGTRHTERGLKRQGGASRRCPLCGFHPRTTAREGRMTTLNFTAKLDARLLSAGHNLTVADLVRLWAEHTPAARPVPERCRACGHFYDKSVPFCPTALVVRPLLRRRRHEAGPTALDLLTTNQLDDLLGGRPSTALTWKADF